MGAFTFCNVHGAYKPGVVKLRPELLDEIQTTVALAIKAGEMPDPAHSLDVAPGKPFALVFHGGSGSAPEEIAQAVSYGVVKSYAPLDAVHYNSYTTTQGILEKAKKGAQNSDYYIQPEVLKLFNGNYGRYGNKQGDMNTCFLSTNDITGGNSGSGMFNGKGELIGLAFDGNWEAMSGDIVFSPKLQRCIGVDIRYVLYVIENYGHADRLINELKLK